ncbi:hypothetical protein JM49_00115 [Pseudomonas chlororaphis subsp. aurantiaca]|nr:hypothetical protein JM49_00115 [Pseudomonas chlororaphis subsp. aurantiaca]
MHTWAISTALSFEQQLHVGPSSRISISTFQTLCKAWEQGENLRLLETQVLIRSESPNNLSFQLTLQSIVPALPIDSRIRVSSRFGHLTSLRIQPLSVVTMQPGVKRLAFAAKLSERMRWKPQLKLSPS